MGLARVVRTPDLGEALARGVIRRPLLAYPLSPATRSKRQASDHGSRAALVLEQLPLADASATAIARLLFPLLEREVLIKMAERL